MKPFLPAIVMMTAAGCGGLDAYDLPGGRLGRVEALDLTPTTQPAGLADRVEELRVLPLTLGDARRLALENNLDLRVTALEPEIAAAEYAAERALYDTVFVVDASYSVTDAPTVLEFNASQSEDLRITPGIVQPLPTGGEVRAEFFYNRLETTNPFATLDTSYETDARFTIDQPLLAGFGTDVAELQLRVASSQLGQARARRALEVVDTLAAVDRAYWQLYRARQTVDVRRQQVELAREQLARAERRFAAGESPEIEVVRARSGLADARELLLQAGGDAGVRQRALKQLIDDNDGGLLSIGGGAAIVPDTPPVPVAYDLDPAALADYAEERRMELLEVRLQVAEQQARVLAASNAVLPTLDLRYQYNVNGLGGGVDDSLDVLSEWDFEDHLVGVNLAYPIGLRAARNQYRAALLRRLQRLADLESRRLLVRRQVFDAVAELDVAFRRIAAAQDRVDAARRLLEAEERQFELGLRTSTEVLEAQTNLAAARLSRVEALADYETGRTNLAAATGTVLGKSGVEIE